MKLAVRASTIAKVKLHSLSSLRLEEVDIVAAPTKSSGITLINLDESAVSTLRSIRNIEALFLNEDAPAELLQPSTASDTASFKSLDTVYELQQYEYLNQLLHIHKAVRDRR